MVKIEEHKAKMKEIQKHIDNSKGIQRKKYIKCYHKLLKQLKECQMYLNKSRC